MEDWIVYGLVITALLAFDIGILGKKDQVISFRQSCAWSFFYFLIACTFGLYIYYRLGADSAREYYTGFFIEKVMALDNIFVISMTFKFFEVPPIYQHRVLFWGILGVISLRAIMIAGGAALITKFSWVLYILAIILIATGVKLLYLRNKAFKIRELYIYKFLQKHLNITSEIKNRDFLTRINGKLYATPLLVALIIIETMDVIFALDSIPAIFAITLDTYIVYTSSIFAVLGLRALFFCLNGVTERFYYVKYSLALILIFIGIKILLSHFVQIPTIVSLSATIILLTGGVVASLLRGKAA